MDGLCLQDVAFVLENVKNYFPTFHIGAWIIYSDLEDAFVEISWFFNVFPNFKIESTAGMDEMKDGKKYC